VIADLPFQAGRDHHAPAQIGILRQPFAHVRRRARHQGEERPLIQDAAVDRGRLDEDEEVFPAFAAPRLRRGSPQRVELLHVADGVEHVDRQGLRSFALHDAFQLERQPLVRLDEVDAPHHAVGVHVFGHLGGEVQGDEGGVGPVEEARREPAMLAERQPVPD